MDKDCFLTEETLKDESGIYMIKSFNNKVYIGQTVSFKRRYHQYCNRHFKSQKLLYNHCNKHSFKNFTFKIIEKCDRSLLDEREIYYISFYKSNKNRFPDENGLNLCDGGNGNKGYKNNNITDELREKRRQQALSNNGVATKVKNNPSLVKGVLNPFYNKKHTDECKSKMGISKRKPFTAISPNGEVVEFQSVYEFAKKVGCHPSSPNKCLKTKRLTKVYGWTNFKFINNDIK